MGLDPVAHRDDGVQAAEGSLISLAVGGSCKEFLYNFSQLGGFLFQFQDVSLDFGKWAQGLELIKILGEVDLIADLGLALVNPGIRHVGLDLAVKVFLDGLWNQIAVFIFFKFFKKRDIFKIAQ